MMRYFMVICLLLTGCVGIPDGIKPIQDFTIQRYLGKWYEIARLDHSFERNLHYVTAEYSLRSDGGVKVLNRGFNTVSKTWNEAEGKAYFVADPDKGHLKVSFFGPFYGSYLIFDLGENYEYALVTSSNRSYFWLLSRTPVIQDTLKKEVIKQLTDLGFDTQALLFVEQAGEVNAAAQ